MELLVARCAGLDVAKDEVVACVRVPDGRGGRAQEVCTFPTFTSGLEALADWLAAKGVTQVVLEATGQYWKPVWYVLEEQGFQLLLVNVRHVKILPGRKTEFPTAGHLASWAGRCPGNNLTGGKRRSGKPTRGNRWLGEMADRVRLGGGPQP